MIRYFLLISIPIFSVGIYSNAYSAESVAYTYDAKGRVVAAVHSGTVNNNIRNSICHDAADNRSEYKSDSAGAGLTCAPTVPRVLPSFSINDRTVVEGQQATFTVTKTGTSGDTLTINYATAYGTAGSSDYYVTTGTLIFTPTDISKVIIVTTINNTIKESTEYFYMNLSNVSADATISDAQGKGTITDND